MDGGWQQQPPDGETENTGRQEPLRLAIIAGSTRAGGFGDIIARWMANESGRHGGYAVDLVDLRTLDRLGWVAAGRDRAGDDFLERIERADAIIVVTPEYNHGYPAALKHAIDLGYSEWHAKPVGFVSYGGMSGGLRAVEQLRQVFSELHTVTMRDTVSFHRVQQEFDEAGALRDPEGAGAAAQTLLRQLAWWGTTLRQARAVRPYAATGGADVGVRQLPPPG